MNQISTQKFDPEEHTNNVYEAFCDFLEEFNYEYEAMAKEPPRDLANAGEVAAWVSQNKRKVFLGKFRVTKSAEAFRRGLSVR